MLDEDYTLLLERVTSKLDRQINLPVDRDRFFAETGPTPSYPNDARAVARTNARTTGVLVSNQTLAFHPRSKEPMPIYTKDFSKSGFGFVAKQQYLPGESVRVLLATFWMLVAITRCNRLGPDCFECGGILISRHDPSKDAFVDIC